MKTILIHNRKGGVGKTSMSGNIAYLLSKKNKVLLMDTDGQANLSNWLVKENFKYDLGDVLNGQCDITQSIQKVRESLDILPLLAVDSSYQSFVETKLMSEVFIFSDLKDEIKKEKYDYLVIDTPPQGGLLMASVLSIVDEVLLILNGDTFSIEGLEVLLEFLSEVKRQRKVDFKQDKIILNKINLSMSLHKGYMEALKKTDKELYVVKQYQEFSNSIARGGILAEQEEIPELVTLCKKL